MKSSPSPDISGAIRLRRWALGALVGVPEPPPTDDPASWRSFLGREAIAPRLLAAVSPALPVLSDAAARDAQLILLLQAELEAVAAVAREVGVAPVVLKGGAALHVHRRAVRAKDIDLLLAPADALRLAAALDAAGWRPHGGGSQNHLAERVREGRPPVEIHTTAAKDEVLRDAALLRARPHPTLAGALLLHPDDHLRHLAIHQTVEHAAYRGRLRDLLLLADAIADGGADTPEGWSLPPHQRRAVDRVLAMARGLHARVPVRDQFEALATAWYLMERSVGGRDIGVAGRVRTIWTHAFLAGDGAPRDLWATTWSPRLDARSHVAAVRAIAARSSVIGRAVRFGLRAAVFPLVIGAAWLTSRRWAHAARRALRAADPVAE